MTAFDKAWKFVKYEAVSTGGATADSGFGNPGDGKLQTALDAARNRKPRPPLQIRVGENLDKPFGRNSSKKFQDSNKKLVQRAKEAVHSQRGGYRDEPDPRGDQDTFFA
jgi:hypothetical protein